MNRPRTALVLAAILVAFGLYVGLAQPFETEGWGLSYAMFTLALLAGVYAAIDRLASAYRRRQLKR